MGLFGKKIEYLDKYRTDVVYEATYVATYKDGSKKRKEIQLNCGLNGAILLKEVCRKIKYADENIVKVKIRNLRIKRIVAKDNVIYEQSELW